MKKLCVVLFGLACALGRPAAAQPQPGSVTVAGSLQDELGCPADWQPECVSTDLTWSPEDRVWEGSFTLPAGTYEYKVAIDHSWDENYGANAESNGSNIALDLAAETVVRFYYSHATHWVVASTAGPIVTAFGTFQSEMGCASDDDPACLRSWLQDPDGDGVYTLDTPRIPAGSYQMRAAHGQSLEETYGEGGVAGGDPIGFTVATDCAATRFSYTLATHALTVGPAPAPSQPSAATAAGSFQSEVGCPGDWMADCAATHLAFDEEDGVWQGTFTIPAGAWEYKVTLDDAWDESYGVNAQRGGANIPFSTSEESAVRFYYSHATHWAASGAGDTIATAIGTFQSELGCAGDWAPGCLRSWLQDPDGNGVFELTVSLPAGDWLAKVAEDEALDVTWGLDGAAGGADIPFAVAVACEPITFSWDTTTHVMAIAALECVDEADCDDDNPCTDDACTPSGCTHVDNTASCEDGAFCNGAETCAAGTCQAGTAPCAVDEICDEDGDACVECLGEADCDDDNDCTDDACLEGVCENTNNTDACDDGLFCTATDACSGGACVGSGDPCDGANCNEGANTCGDCGSADDCDDDESCTIDTCDGTGHCQHAAMDDNTACTDDGLFCNGAESCLSGVCTSEGDPCDAELETCVEDGDACVGCGNDVVDAGEACDDGNTDDGDGCDADCAVESGWVCDDSEPSVCAEDADGDTVPDEDDNCPDVANPGQEDADDNGIGDACEDTGSEGEEMGDGGDEVGPAELGPDAGDDVGPGDVGPGDAGDLGPGDAVGDASGGDASGGDATGGDASGEDGAGGDEETLSGGEACGCASSRGPTAPELLLWLAVGAVLWGGTRRRA